MKKRRPVYLELEGMANCWAVLLPSSKNDEAYKQEEELLEALVKREGLRDAHKDFKDYMEFTVDEDGARTAVISQEMIDTMMKYVHIVDETKDYLLLFYDVEERKMNEFVGLFCRRCEEYFGYTF